MVSNLVRTLVGLLLLRECTSLLVNNNRSEIRRRYSTLNDSREGDSHQHADDGEPSSSIATNVVSRSAFLASLILLPAAAPAMAATDVSREAKSSQTFEESVSGFVAGAALAGAKTLVKYPLDSATVRLQMPNSDYSLRDLERLFDGSYRGVAAPLVSNIPAGAVFFGVKDAVKAAMSSWDGPRWLKTLGEVAAAQMPYWLLRNPSEVVKTRQQAGLDGYGEGVSGLDAYQNLRNQAMKNNNSTTGLEDFYIGYWENIFYAYPADVIKFVCYDQLSNGRKDLSPIEGALAGAAATAIAQLATTPLDVVRNRIMTQSDNNNPTSDEHSSPLSYTESLAQLAREEGLAGLFAGASPRVGKAVLSGAIQFAAYEETKQQVAKFFQR